MSWVTLGIGTFSDDTYTGPTDSKGGISLYGSFNLYRSIKLKDEADNVKISHGATVRIINHFMTINEDLWLHYSDLDLMYGLVFGRICRFNMAGGVGLLKYDSEVVVYPKTGTNGIPYSKIEKNHGVSLPLEAGISLAPLKGFGLGIGVFANINSKKSVNGAFVRMDLGKLR
jgi:hypothetical protein